MEALSTLALVVKVVEATSGATSGGTAQALVPNSRATESESTITTDGETRSVDSTSLGRTIELELPVVCDVTNTALRVGEDTVGECDGEDISVVVLRLTL